MNIDYWGTYGNSDLTPIPGLRAGFTVAAPTWSGAEITDDHRLRIEGLSNVPNPAPFICQMKIHFGIPPLAFVELTHYLLIGASLLPPMNTMECGIEPSNPESFTDILVRAIESVHGKLLYPEGAVWSNHLEIKPRLYNGGISFLMTSDGKPIEPDLFQRGYYLSEEDMGDAPDEYVEGNPLDRGSLTLPPVPIEQTGTVTAGVNFRQKENGRENLSGRGNLSKNDRVTLFLNPLTGERIAKRWTYDNNRGPLDFYLIRSPSGELGWAYSPYIN